MKQGSIAKRYATALLQVALEQGKIDQFQSELEAVDQAFLQNPNLQSAMTSPVIPASKKKELSKVLVAKMGLCSTVGNLLHVLVDNERISEFHLLTLLFRDLADAEKGRVRVQVTSAAPLGSHEGKLKSILEKTLKQEVLLETQVDPQILGGVVVQVQDRVFNASLKGELDRLKESLTAEAVV